MSAAVADRELHALLVERGLDDLSQPMMPATLWVPPRAGSYGPVIADWWVDELGGDLDVEQRRDLDVLASYRPGGNWLTLEQCIIEGRQNGKTKAVVLPLVMADLWLFEDEPDRVIWTSHLVSTSLDTFKRIKQLIEANPTLSRRVERIQESKTEQGVFLTNGSSLEFFARTVGGGRGLGGKRVVFDEALFLLAGPMGALIPTLSARRNPQVTYASSPGLVTSSHLRKLQRRGRSLADPSLTFIEYRSPGSWTDPGCELAELCPHTYGTDGCSLDDEWRWLQANHAIRRERISLDFVRAERRTLTPTEFGRERVGWEEAGDDAESPIVAADWLKTGRPIEYQRPLGIPVFYLDVAPNQRAATIASAVDDRTGGQLPHVELVAHRLGVDWLVEVCKVLHKRYPKAVFGASTTGGIKAHLPGLKLAGIDLASSKRHRLFSVADVAAGFAHLKNLNSAPYGFTHSHDKLFDTAIEGSTSTPVGDGLWILDRKGEQTVELSPLYGAAGAGWLLEQTRAARYPIMQSVF